jgi:L-fucose mutarotase/ribose pyranase (RbsD/FucU family)
MPPFREGPVIVTRKLDGETLQELRTIGHEHQVNIVDASYDIPRGARTVNFPGSSAEALLGIARLIPIEDDAVSVMVRDRGWGDENPAQATTAFEEVAVRLRSEGIDLKELIHSHRNYDAGSPKGAGFYDVANSAPAALFVRTIDDLPFACASLVVGHSQRTE